MAPPSRRRTVLKVIGLGLGSAAAGQPSAASEGTDDGYVVVQGDRCVPVTPMTGDLSAAAFYDYRQADTDYSSAGTVDLQRDDTSILFLYEGPDAVSLVLVHGRKRDTVDPDTGGSVSMSLSGLPSGGTWVVEDDNYEGPTSYDVWDHGDTTSDIDWTWAGGRTDGGVFEGMTRDATVRIVPAFNEDAALHGEHYGGEVTSWELLTGDASNPRVTLSMDKPVTIRGGGCPDDGSDGSSSDDGSDGSSTDDGDSSSSDEDGDQTDDDGKDTKHTKHQRKHGKKHQRKHGKKHQRKHEKKQEKHRRKHERKQEKHRKKHRKKQEKHQRKHEKKQEKHRKKHERKQGKHRKKEEKHRKKGGKGSNGRGKQGKHRKQRRKHENDQDD